MDQIENIHRIAVYAAQVATAEHIAKHGEGACCGFAWVSLYDVKLSTKVGKAFKALGWKKSWARGIQFWNPSGSITQSIDAKEAGAYAYAEILREAGYMAYAGSRMD